MKIPKFLMGDHSDYSDSIFVIHTEFPRFIINLIDDEIEWLEELNDSDTENLTGEVARLIEDASLFYDSEMKSYEEN